MKIKNIRKILVVVIVAFFVGLSVVSSIHATTIKNVKNYLLSKTYTKIQTSSFDDYIPHDPIYISGNDDFTAENGVTGGNGTADDPYVIEGWEIDASKNVQGGIRIEDTDCYFVIRNCKIYNGEKKGFEGISFISVANGKIEKCNLVDNWYGINAYQSGNIVIENTTFFSNSGGVKLDTCSNILIIHSEFRNTGSCAQIMGCSRIRIKYNNISDNLDRSGNLAAIFVGLSGASIEKNNIANNIPGALISLISVVEARNNWWGSPRGPSLGFIGISPGLRGDIISSCFGIISFKPWETSPITNAGPR